MFLRDIYSLEPKIKKIDNSFQFQVAGDYNWNYLMEKQGNFCLAMEDQLCAWPRGKALGGTTVLNYMIYTRGHADEYDKWGAGTTQVMSGII